MTPRTNLAGTTLAELIVVLVIVAMVSAMVLPKIARPSASTQMQRASMQLANLYRQANTTAKRDGNSKLVLLDTEQKRAVLGDGRAKIELNREFEVETTTAETESGPGIAGIRFFADGTSTGGEIHLFYQDQTRTIHINWANGAVDVQN